MFSPFPNRLEIDKMAKNWVQKGEVVTFVAPTGGVTVGVPTMIGALPVVPDVTAAEGVAFEGHLGGVWNFNTKVSADEPTLGQTAYMTPAGAFTVADDVGNFPVGVFLDSGGNGSTACTVRLDGVATAAVAGP